MTRVFVVVAMLAACNSSKPERKVIETKVGPIEVVDHPPPDGEFLCSADYKVHPMSELHVVPTFNDGSYSGGYRCDADWKAAIEETRARIHAHPTEEEVGGMLQVFAIRGATDQLRPLTTGKSLVEAADAALDALASEKIKLAP